MSPFVPLERFTAQALLVGERIDVRGFAEARVLALSPLTVSAGERGVAVLFRYGAVVLFQLTVAEGVSFLEWLAPRISGRFATPRSDGAVLRIAADEPEGPDREGALVLREASLERIQLVAHALARSALLAHYEAQLAEELERLEPLAERLRVRGRTGLGGRALLRQLGEVLSTQIRMLGRAEVGEKPEMVWERPDLDRLYVRFVDEFELDARDRALTRKLQLLSQTTGTFLEMLQSRRSLRVEWYIVSLILVEIVILIWDLFWRGG